MNIPKSPKSKKYPKFIRDHFIFNKYGEGKKIFPKLGLKNNSEKFNLCDYKIIYGDFYINGWKHYYYNSSNSKFAVKDKKVKIINDLNYDIGLINRAYPEQYSLIDLQKKNLRINFSSNGSKGHWDIATMSMRGISSCQKWSNHTYATGLVGSMVDPYCGIIYISSDKELRYGSKMIRRSVVRLIVDERDNSKAIFIEKAYPNTRSSNLVDYITGSVFAEYIAKKTKNKYPIYYHNKPNDNYSIFRSKQIDFVEDDDQYTGKYSDLLDYGEGSSNDYTPYVDSGLTYSNIMRKI